MRSTGRPVSLRDVALAAGVSVASASRVLNRSGYASAQLRQRVERAVLSTGYVPNFSARHLKTGRSMAVGFMVSTMANPFLSAFFAAVETRMQAAGLSVLVASTFDSALREAELLHLFENRRLEGAFVSPSDERQSAAFARSNLPLVVLDRDIDFPADAVLQEHRGGLAQAVAHLADLGHRRIALFGPNLGIRPGREKLLGYRDGLARAAIDFDPALVCMLDSAVQSSQDQMTTMLALRSPPTALIALGTRLLSGALRSARAAGRTVPRDLSVIGIGTDDAFALMDPPLTTLRVDIERLAQAAASLMLRRIDERSADKPRRITVPLELVVGASCRRVRP